MPVFCLAMATGPSTLKLHTPPEWGKSSVGRDRGFQWRRQSGSRCSRFPDTASQRAFGQWRWLFPDGKGLPDRGKSIVDRCGDFNGDGKLDLALTSTPLGSSPGNLVSLLLGNGDGTFGAPALFGAGYLSYSSAVGRLQRGWNAGIWQWPMAAVTP